MKLQLLVVLSAFSALSLQSPLPQTTAALSSATDLPISAPSEVTPTPIKLFGDETQGGSMASSFSSDLSSAIANPGQFMQTHHWVIPALLVVLALFIGVLIWGYKRRQAKREEEEYDDQDDGGKQGSNNNYGGGQGQGYGGGQGQGYGGDQGQGYVGGQTQGYARNNGAGGRGAGGGGKKIDEKEAEGEESEEGEE